MSRLFSPALKVAACGALLVFVLFGAVVSGVFAAPSTVPEILAPHEGELVTSPVLSIKVRVPDGAKDITLHVNGRTGVLRGSGATRIAGVATAGLHRGPALIVIRGRADGKTFAADRTVLIGRLAPTLVRSTPTVKVTAGHAVLSLNLRERPSQTRFRLNGKPVTLLRAPESGSQRFQLSADDGLAFGTNTLGISVYDRAHGVWDRVTKRFNVSRATPLAAAGPDQRVIAGANVELSAAHSQTNRSQMPLGYRWQIVSQPKGANATVDGATSLRPRVKTTRPGRYRIRLELTIAASGRAARTAGNARASDTVTVDAAQSAPPYGIPITTMATVPWTSDPVYQTIIQGVPIANGDGQDFDVVPPNAIDYYVLDRSTLAVKVTAQMLLNPSQSDIQNALNGFTDQDLVIMVGNTCCGTTKFTNLGPVDTSTNFTTIFVGDHPTTPIAYNNGIVGQTNAGGLTGVLRPAVAENGDVNFSFYDPEAVSFDTNTPSSSGGNQMTFGTMDTSIPSAGTGIVLFGVAPDLKTANWREQFQLDGNPTDDAATLNGLAYDLNNLHSPNEVIELQTYGKPKATTTAWGNVGDALYNFGGTPSLWDALDGTGDYALIGVAKDYANMSNAADVRAVSAAEASQVASQGSATSSAAPWTGTLRGVIGRGPDGSPIIRSSTSAPAETSDGARYLPTDLTPLADQAPGPWPLSDPAHTAALQWISQQLGPIDPSTQKPEGLGDPNTASNDGWCYQPTTWDLRAEYCNKNLADSWSSTFTTQLNTLDCPTDGTGFTQTQCQDVVGELKQEFTAIPIVASFITNLQQPYLTANATLAMSFITAADAVTKSLTVTPPLYQFQMQEMMDLTLGPLQDVDAPEGAEDFPLMMGLLNSAVDAGLGGMTDDNGNPALGQFTDTKDAIAGDVQNRLVQSAANMSQLQDILVSDYTKLMTTADRAAGVWSISGLSSNSATATITAATKQWLYGAMLPDSYGQIQVKPQSGTTLDDVNNVNCSYGPYPYEYTRWPFVPGATPNLRSGAREGGTPLQQSAAFTPADGTDANGNIVSSQVWTIGNEANSESFQQPTSTLTDPLWQPINAGGVGLLAPEFFTWAWQGNRIMQFDSAIKKMGGTDCGTN